MTFVIFIWTQYSSLFVITHTHTHTHTHTQRSEAPLISRHKDDAYTYGEEHNVLFTSASSPL